LEKGWHFWATIQTRSSTRVVRQQAMIHSVLENSDGRPRARRLYTATTSWK